MKHLRLIFLPFCLFISGAMSMLADDVNKPANQRLTARNEAAATKVMEKPSNKTSGFVAIPIARIAAEETPFVAVTGITGVPATTIVGEPLSLTGIVNPANATNKDIVWSIKDAGTTGATITGDVLNATTTGTVTVRATIIDGLADSSTSDSELLWDNSDINYDTWGIISNYWSGNDNWVFTADDFIADAVWTIEKVYSKGFSTGLALPVKMAVTIYADDGNKPGLELYRELAIPVADGANPEIVLPTPFTLPDPGKYWISIAGAFDATVNTTSQASYYRWDIYFGNNPIGANFHIWDKQGMFGAGALDWADATPLLDTEGYSMYFKIEGTARDYTQDFIITVTEEQMQTLHFTWDAAAGVKSFGPMVPLGTEFTVDWGDGSTTAEIGTGKREEVTHTYAAAGSYDVTVTGNTFDSFDFLNKQLTTIDLSNCSDLLYLFCEVNELTSLDLSACTKLEYLYCFGNHLLLSDLYAASKKIATQNHKQLGTQLLNPQIVQTGDVIDYSSQYEFATGVYTSFLVEKEGVAAVINVDYTQADGKITFIAAGDYTVTMTNTAIVSAEGYPAKVIATFRVEEASSDYVCKIVDTGGGERFFTDFGNAIAAVADGETIVLLVDIVYTDGIIIDGISITIDLDNQYMLKVTTTGTCLELKNNGEIKLAGDVPGVVEFVLISSEAAGVNAETGSKATVSYATGGIWGVNAQGAGTSVTVKGDVDGELIAAEAGDGATIIVKGNLTGSNASDSAHGIVVIDAGSSVTVEGNVTADEYGVSVYSGATATIGGNVAGNYAVHATGTGATIMVEGNVTGVSRGVLSGEVADHECTVIVNGTITGTTYITVNGFNKVQNNGVPISGYLEFKEGKSIVKVKDTSPFVAVISIKNLPTMASEIAGTLLVLEDLRVDPVNATMNEIDLALSASDPGTVNATINARSFLMAVDGKYRLHFNFEITAANAGTLILTATVKDGVAPGTDYTQDITITVSDNTPVVDAEAPLISQHPQDATVEGGESVVLQVMANSADGGVLSYQWYSNNTNTNTGGTAIGGETGASYFPSTAKLGIRYYYVVVTNTNNGVSGTTTASITSNAATVKVNKPEPAYYNIIIGTFPGGAVHVDTNTSIENKTVTLNIQSDEDYELLKIAVHQKDNTNIGLILSGSGDIRTFTMPAFDVVVVAYFEYAGVITGIDNTSQAKAMRAWVQNGTLHVEGLTEGKPWNVYNISGSLIYQNIAGNDEAEISLPARGVYIVTSENETVKVMN